jgi:hypothetical protein
MVSRPGVGDFLYVPRAGVHASATMAFDPINRLLDPAGLRANRKGRLGPMQLARLGGGAYRSRLRREVLFAACVVAAGAAVYYAANLGDSLVLAGPALAVVALSAFVFRPWEDPLGRDVQDGRVERVTGSLVSAARVDRPSRSFWGDIYHVSIGAVRFPVPAWIWSAMDDARTVTAYYLPRSMTLVSIEAADGRDQPPILPLQARREPIRSGRRATVAYFAAVGIGLLIRAFLPPVELVPEIPAGLLFLSIAAAIFARSRREPG